MASENIERVRAAFDAYARGDEPAMIELVAENIVVTQFSDQPDVRDYHGREGFREVMTQWLGAWDEWSIELLRAREAGAFVIVGAHQRGRGKVSGAPMEADVTFVFEMRDGMVARWQMFHSEEEALAAVGLAG